MKRFIVLAFVCALASCDTTDTDQSIKYLTNNIVVTNLEDECPIAWPNGPFSCPCSVVDGDCTPKEAECAANGNVAVDACPAGIAESIVNNVPVNWDRIQLPEGTYSIGAAPAGYNPSVSGPWAARSGVIRIRSSIELVGVGATRTVLDANDVDRAVHTGWGSKIHVELNDLVLDDCTASGDGSSLVNGVPATGGCYYHVAPGVFRSNNVRITNSASNRPGSAIAFCTDPPMNYSYATSGTWTDFEVTNMEIDHTTGTAAIFSHLSDLDPLELPLRFINLNVHDNVTNQPGANGTAVLLTNGEVTCTNCTFSTGSNTSGSGVVALLGQAQPYGRPQAFSVFRMTGGSITGSTLAGHGAVSVNGGQGGTDLLGFNGWCGGTGCLGVFTDVLISMNAADSTPGGVAGSGGGLSVNGTGTAPGRVELRGSSSVANNTDGSTSPTYGPDCFASGMATISLYGTSSIGNTTGCAAFLLDFRTCGNGVVDAGEQCDDGNTTNGDCCSAGCAFESMGSPCSDGDACTLGDSCDGMDSCAATPPCGNGILQVSCGEICDDGNANDGDGCHSNCDVETCSSWSYP